MKKNIIISILILITAFNMTYAFLKASEAEQAAARAYMNQQEAEALRDEAEVLRNHAQEAAAEAMRQERLAKQALQDCQNK